MQSTWTFAGEWNKALDQDDQRQREPRNYLYASELYKSDIDIVLNLLGEEQTNIPNTRSRRKFHAGNIWEWVVALVLDNMGILQSQQDRIKYSIQDGLLEVSGKVDFIVGGTVLNKEKALANLQRLEEMQFPKLYIDAGRNFIETYADIELEKKIVELKSVSSFGFDQVERTGKPLRGHDLQLYHYTRGMQMQGALVYICRDDARIIEIPILQRNPSLEERYIDKMNRITNHYVSGTMPEKEPFILFDENASRFSKNFNIEYSSYLTKLYGYEEPAQYAEIAGKMATRFNRVLNRIKKGDKMTKLNLEIIQEIKDYGYDPDVLVKQIADIPEEEEAI